MVVPWLVLKYTFICSGSKLLIIQLWVLLPGISCAYYKESIVGRNEEEGGEQKKSFSELLRNEVSNLQIDCI